ncbi:hypothetical protein D9Q98_005156 [Chlorella vulgaris]|uniref:Uncharacterized protein n=1 Tax=Chlorella vulgaris TaxID=3077 RepID=A0A9D4TNX5_CHLVU|nr:hypothetical protein D9Q98_005156 [Chlorella vulgaris]
MKLSFTVEPLTRVLTRSSRRSETTATTLHRQQLHRMAHRTNSVAAASAVEALGSAADSPPATASASSTPAAASAPCASSLTYTSYEGNSFAVEFPNSGVNVLVDPWLVGKLSFGGLEFIYAGSKRVAHPDSIDVDALARGTDLLVLTQGIDDHAHKPTLKRLPKTLPVVASASGAAVARSLGFRSVTTLDHGQTLTLLDGRLTIQGTAGALVGPPWSKRELGVVLRENLEGGGRGASLYYEPHADYQPDSVEQAVAKGGPVDVVVSPPCSQSLFGYPLVKGSTDSVALLRMLKPKAFVPLMNAEIDQAGPLSKLVTETGSTEQLQKELAAEAGLSGIRVCVPVPAQPLSVEL